MIVQKKHGKRVGAYQLGEGAEAERRMIAEGKIVVHPDGSYELFSQESAEHGERAQAGDFFKIDSSDYPYPNEKSWFIENHRPTAESNIYEQIPKPLLAWNVDEPECEEITWLKQQGKLIVNSTDTQHYFAAELWGTIERTPKDSIIVFYGVTRDKSGAITDVDFNFVARAEFEKTYDIVK